MKATIQMILNTTKRPEPTGERLQSIATISEHALKQMHRVEAIVRPCVYVGDDEVEEASKDQTPDFFGVYVTILDGTTMLVNDCELLNDAEILKNNINKVLNLIGF
ncbi:MAG: hypothetical protein QM762_12450 [Chryseolinea sp.]